MTAPFVRVAPCLCTEEWYPIPMCEGGTKQRYSYGFWVHPDCGQHNDGLRAMQEWIKEVHGNELD